MTEIESTPLSKLPENPPEYPEIPSDWSRSCVFCGEGTVELEGYANIYSAVYRCGNCGESMTCQPDMNELHWRYQVFPLTLETNSFDRDVRYPMRGVQIRDSTEKSSEGIE